LSIGNPDLAVYDLYRRKHALQGINMAHSPVHLYNDMVRFEDIDAAAIVYHPTYLSYLERARSQILFDLGYSFKRLLDEELGMVIASADMKFIKPLYLENRFVVLSQIDDYGKSFFNITQALTTDMQNVTHGNLKSELRSIKNLHFYAHIKIVTISRKTMRPTQCPLNLFRS
jgi:YbgC/YbaW family acyl-CoA thioester hydrolase